MQRGLVARGQSRVRGLLHAVVQEREAPVDERCVERIGVGGLEPRQRHDEALGDRGREVRGGFAGRTVLDAREHTELEAVADRGRHTQHVARRARQLL